MLFNVAAIAGALPVYVGLICFMIGRLGFLGVERLDWMHGGALVFILLWAALALVDRVGRKVRPDFSAGRWLRALQRKSWRLLLLVVERHTTSDEAVPSEVKGLVPEDLLQARPRLHPRGQRKPSLFDYGAASFALPAFVLYLFLWENGELDSLAVRIALGIGGLVQLSFISSALVAWRLRYFYRWARLSSGRVRAVVRDQDQPDVFVEVEFTDAEERVTCAFRADGSCELKPGAPVGVMYLPGRPQSARIYESPLVHYSASATTAESAGRIAAANELPGGLVAGWFLTVLLAPGIGWLITHDGIWGPLLPETWSVRAWLRVAVSGLGPLLWFVALQAYVIRKRKFLVRNFIAAMVFTVGSAASVWWTAADLLHGPVTGDFMIHSFRNVAGDDEQWQRSFPVAGVPVGRYEARFADGRLMQFRCEPVCLRENAEPAAQSNGRSLAQSGEGLRVRATILRALGRLIDAEVLPEKN